jgi:hypothetical protein
VSIFERRQITALEKIFERRQITALEKFYSADFLPVLCVSAAEQLGPAELFGAGSLLGCAAAVSSVTTGRQTIFFVLFPFPVRWRSAHPGLRFLLHEPAACSDSDRSSARSAHFSALVHPNLRLFCCASQRRPRPPRTGSGVTSRCCCPAFSLVFEFLLELVPPAKVSAFAVSVLGLFVVAAISSISFFRLIIECCRVKPVFVLSY